MPVDDAKDALQARLRHPFLFTFAVAALHENWKFLYALWRSSAATTLAANETIDSAWKAFGHPWLCTSILWGLGAVVTVPLFKVATDAYDTWAQTRSKNNIARMQKGELFDLHTISQNTEYQKCLRDAAGMREYVGKLYERFAPRAPRQEARRMKNPSPGFAYISSSGDVVTFARSKIGEEYLERLVYVSEVIDQDLVLVTRPGGIFKPMAQEAPRTALFDDGEVRVTGNPPPTHPNVIAHLSLSDVGSDWMCLFVRKDLHGTTWVGS